MKDAISQDLHPGDWVMFVSGMNGGSMAFGKVIFACKDRLVVEAPRKTHNPLPGLQLYRQQKSPGRVVKVPRVPISLRWLWERME